MVEEILADAEIYTSIDKKIKRERTIEGIISVCNSQDAIEILTEKQEKKHVQWTGRKVATAYVDGAAGSSPFREAAQ